MTRVLRAIFVLLWVSGQFLMAQTTGSIQGKVTDSSGAAVLGAVVTVEGADGTRHTTVSDGSGAFEISSLALGDYTVKVSSSHFSDWTQTNVPATAGPALSPMKVVLDLAPNVTTVTVGVGPDEVAAEQVKQELKQRALGVIPNFFVTYDNHPAPLSAQQKFHLGWRALADPTTLAVTGISAGIEQKRNSYYQFGQGTEGFAKRFGANYATTSSGILITAVLMNSILHQDPRYYYAGRAYGNRPKRALYAVEAAFRTKGDNGQWQPPYSDLVGLVGSAELSETYNPGARTQYTLLGRALLFRFAGRIGVNLFQELLLKQVTSNAPDSSTAANVAVLREGTPVPLIAVRGFGPEGVTSGETVSFVLARDLVVDGKIVAKTGDVASGQVGQTSSAQTPNEAANVGLERVTLQTGGLNVPLRSSQVRGAVSPMQYKELPGSGKMEVTLYVAESVRFPES